jgi:hypothetical protein
MAQPLPPEPTPAAAPEPAAATTASSAEAQPLAPMIVVETARPLAARVGIVALTVVSVAIILFSLMVLAGHFRGGRKHRGNAAAATQQEGRPKPPFLTTSSRTSG